MELSTHFIELETQGRTDLIDITPQVQDIISGAGLTEGSATIFGIGSTTGISTVEFEPGLVKGDIPRLFDHLAPYGPDYKHHGTWGDDNGASHVRATLQGCNLVVPFFDGKLLLGTWQQIVFMDFDTRARARKIVVQVSGKK